MDKRDNDRATLLRVALDVAHRLTQFETYGGSEARALGALKRRCPQFDESQYGQALSHAIAMVRDARRLVDSRAQQLLRDPAEVDDLVPKLRERQPGFADDEYHSIMRWMLYYWHER